MGITVQSLKQYQCLNETCFWNDTCVIDAQWIDILMVSVFHMIGRTIFFNIKGREVTDFDKWLTVGHILYTSTRPKAYIPCEYYWSLGMGRIVFELEVFLQEIVSGRGTRESVFLLFAYLCYALFAPPVKYAYHKCTSVGPDDVPRECAVCMDSNQASQWIELDVCNHAFHEKCLRPWLNRNPTCPLCRKNVQKSLQH